MSQLFTLIIILMFFFSNSHLHQVLAEDSNITKATEAIIKAVKANGPCNDVDFEEAIKSCVVIRNQQMADAQNPETRCIALYNEALCTIDASCQLCNPTTATKTEADIKKTWSDKEGKYKQCAPYYDDFEYSHKQRCYPAQSDLQINQMVNTEIRDLESHGSCKAEDLKEPIKACILEANKKNQGQDLKAQCQNDFNRTLCYIDAACKHCTAKTAVDVEAALKKFWADKDGIKKDCAPWYEGYEYAHKQRCKPALIMAIGWLVIVAVVICLCGCAVGVWCYCGRKENKEGKILAKAGSGVGGGSKSKMSAVGSKRSAKSGVKSSVPKSAVKYLGV